MCDRHNETSQQRLLGRQSILLTKVCDCSPPCLCASREAVEAEPWKAGTHSQKASLMLAFPVFYMICDKIMSLNSIPEKKSHMGCNIPRVSLLWRRLGLLSSFLKCTENNVTRSPCKVTRFFLQYDVKNQERLYVKIWCGI